MNDPATVRVPPRLQGPTGVGQGGWTAHRVQQLIGESVSIALRAPIPLDSELVVERAGDEWHLVDGTSVLMVARRWQSDVPTTAAVTIAEAALAGRAFPLGDDHPVPVCFSCGLQSDSMQVHSGALPDGRWATDWTAPSWATDADGNVDEAVAWAAIDCAQAWYVSLSGERRSAVTVQIAVEMHRPLTTGGTYAVVAWNGDYDDAWDGRKRGACGAMFDDTGDLVASSRTFWVATAS